MKNLLLSVALLVLTMSTATAGMAIGTVGGFNGLSTDDMFGGLSLELSRENTPVTLNLMHLRNSDFRETSVGGRFYFGDLNILGANLRPFGGAGLRFDHADLKFSDIRDNMGLYVDAGLVMPITDTFRVGLTVRVTDDNLSSGNDFTGRAMYLVSTSYSF